MASAVRPDSKNQPALVDEHTSLGAGDTYVVYNILPQELANAAYEKLVEEVQWIKMMHHGGEVPRLVAQQGEILDNDGTYPIYRHPADESPPLLPFSSTVQDIREHVQKVLKHPVNHVLIQHYRTGADYISDHSDKTVDIVPNSFIVNVSLGAQRTMILRMKESKASREQRRQQRQRLQAAIPASDANPTGNIEQVHTLPPPPPPPPRPTQRVPLPHNSMFVLGLETNRTWLHGISTDKRPLTTKSPSEQINSGARISLTFRWIGTFINPKARTIWGIGAKGKTQEEAGRLLDETTEEGAKETEKLLIAFGEENQDPGFVWERRYAGGFNVVNFKPVA